MNQSKVSIKTTISFSHMLCCFSDLSEIRLNNRDTVKSAKEASTEIAKNGILFIETAKEVVNRQVFNLYSICTNAFYSVSENDDYRFTKEKKIPVTYFLSMPKVGGRAP